MTNSRRSKRRGNASSNAQSHQASTQNPPTSHQNTQNRSKKRKRVNNAQRNQKVKKQENVVDEGAEFLRPALDFHWDENFVPKGPLNPMEIDDPEEYLRMVRYEANQLPQTMEMDTTHHEDNEDTHAQESLKSSETPFSEQWAFYQQYLQKKDATGEVRNRLNNDAMTQKYLERFVMYRHMVDKARSSWKERQMQISEEMSTGLPNPRDWAMWKQYILNERHAPVAVILLSMDYTETLGLTKNVISWVQKAFRDEFSTSDKTSSAQSTTTSADDSAPQQTTTTTDALPATDAQSDSIHHLLFWTYTLLAHLEDPISARTLSTISEFTKWLVEQRSQLPGNHDLLPHLHTLIVLGVHHFVQGKKEWV